MATERVSGDSLPSSDGTPNRRRAGAFVADPETRDALHRALPEWELEVRDGNVRTAVGVLADNRSPKLLFVDLDGVTYPAGSIHELATVCEVGTVVIALGSRDDARFSRDVLTTGVADYLIKPIAPGRLREVAASAGAASRRSNWRGRSVGFAGTGGSGATTLLVATAARAAAGGSHVAVVDLHRAFSAHSFLLDVEPATGFDELLDAAASGVPDPELVDAARVPHSDRLSVYGYRWSPILPPAATLKGVRQLLEELCNQFHLVLVDPEPRWRVAVVRDCDVQVLVTEPTQSGVRRSLRVRAGLEGQRPTVHVHNRTRGLRRSAALKALRAAGIEQEPDVEFPFDATLPELSDWGYLHDRLPRQFRAPLGKLVDLLVAGPGADGQAAPALTAAA